MAFDGNRERCFWIGDAEEEQRSGVACGLADGGADDCPISTLPAARDFRGIEFQSASGADGCEVRELAYLLQRDGGDAFRGGVLGRLLVFDLHAGFTCDAALETNFIESFLALDRDEIRDGGSGGADGGGGGFIKAGDADAQGFESCVFDAVGDRRASERLAFAEGGLVENFCCDPRIEPADGEAERPVTL